MTFEEILDQALAMLQRRRRVTYTTLRLQFQLDDEQLAALKDELLYSQPHVIDDAGRGLVWTGDRDTTAPLSPTPTPPAADEDSHGQTTRIAPPPVALHIADAERRQLTVMFCDLVDSTRLSGQLDPEDLREVVRTYQRTCAEVIQRFDGHIAQLLGDGLLVYFGYPHAHEDDAYRAVRSGLEIVDAVRTLPARVASAHGLHLAVRVGIHTGLVVVGEMGGGDRQEQLALGETPNIAARLQGVAAPNTVIVSEATTRLTQGFFLCQALGAQELKGLAQPLMVYQILRESGAQTRFEVATNSGLAPLVGRTAEVTLLQERWARAKEGVGQVVLLHGEPGIGKSRLVQVLKDQVADEPHFRWECRCSPYHQHSALYPLIDLLQRILRWQEHTTPSARLSQLEQALGHYRLSLAETVPLVAALLSLPLPDDRYPPLTLTPQQQKHKTLEVILGMLAELAERQPVLFIVEDLHWIDPSTLELLSLLLDQGPTARLLALLTYRPTFHPPWTSRAHITPLALTRLAPVHVETIVVRLTEGKPLPAEVLNHVVAKTDGVPLFVEELTKMVLESGLLTEADGQYRLTGPLPALAIPSTLHDSLMARLDRLAAVKTVAQLGATIGRQFSYALLQTVSPLDEPILQQALQQLVDAELLSCHGLPSQATYLFKHALIQDAAYQSLLRSTRQQYHQRIAQALTEHFPDTAETQPELLAHHYTAASLHEQAIDFWQRAGQRAIQRSAYAEAMAHLTTGIDLLRPLPPTAELLQHELMLQTMLGSALMVAKGQGSPEVGQAYARARELCQQVGETPQLFPVLFGLWRFYLLRGAYQTARELAEQALSVAQRVDDLALHLQARFALGVSLFWLGELEPARLHLEQGIALYNPQEHHALAFRSGIDPGMWCLSYAAFTLWMLGYPDQALQRSQQALTLAEEASHPPSLAAVLAYVAITHYLRREVQATHERAEATITLTSAQGFPQWLVLGTLHRGWALAQQGQAAEGIAHIRQALAAWQSMGAEMYQPWYMGMLAEAYGQHGQIEDGLQILTEALAVTERNREVSYEAELHRLQGAFLLRQTIPDEHQAETCFQQALTLARQQQAKSWELRAAMSLARLWQQQGKCAPARDLLVPIYGWFTEGFDTADLQEAKALLEALA